MILLVLVKSYRKWVILFVFYWWSFLKFFSMMMLFFCRFGEFWVVGGYFFFLDFGIVWEGRFGCWVVLIFWLLWSLVLFGVDLLLGFVFGEKFWELLGVFWVEGWFWVLFECFVLFGFEVGVLGLVVVVLGFLGIGWLRVLLWIFLKGEWCW